MRRPSVEDQARRLKCPLPRSDSGPVTAKKLTLKHPDLCVGCGNVLSAGTPGWWSADTRTVTCTDCWTPQGADAPIEPAPPAQLDCGQPGASLVREAERRKRNREKRAREAHPHIGGFLLALRGTPQHEVAFTQGAAAERAVAQSLQKRADSHGVVALHNRRMPGGLGDIDHIVVAPSGVYVVDTKDWKGKVEIRAPLFSAPKLLIRGRDCTKFIDGLERQIAAVRAALDRDGHEAIPIQGVICFTKADLPLLMTQRFRGHLLLYRKALDKRLRSKGPLERTTIEAIARGLVAALPSAR